jgi:sulfate adenylyltransferase subunit 1
MSDDALALNHTYDIKLGNKKTTGSVTAIDFQVNVNTLDQLDSEEAKQGLQLNEIGSCVVELTQKLAFDRYRDNRQTGSFIIIDRLTNITVAAGLIEAALEDDNAAQSSDVSEFERDLNALVRKHFPHWQALKV